MAKRYVVYEVWTKARTITAKDIRGAYNKGRPKPLEKFNLCNWHVVEIKEKKR